MSLLIRLYNALLERLAQLVTRTSLTSRTSRNNILVYEIHYLKDYFNLYVCHSNPVLFRKHNGGCQNIWEFLFHASKVECNFYSQAGKRTKSQHEFTTKVVRLTRGCTTKNHYPLLWQYWFEQFLSSSIFIHL